MENIRNILLLATLLFGGVYVADSAHTGRQGEGRSVDSPSSMTLFNLIKNTEKAVTKKCVFDDNCLIDNKMKENTTQQDQDSVTVNKHSAKSVFERSELRRPLAGSPPGHRERRATVASSQSVSLPPDFPLLHQDEPRLSLHDTSDPHPGSLPSKTVPEGNSTITSGTGKVAGSVHQDVAPTSSAPRPNATGSDLASPQLAPGFHDLHAPQHVAQRDEVTIPSHHEAQSTLESGGQNPHRKRSPDHYFVDSREVESAEDQSSVGLRTFWSQSYWISGAPSPFHHYPTRPGLPTSHGFKSPTAFRPFSPQSAFPKAPAFPPVPSISPSPFSSISAPSPDYAFPSAPFTPAPSVIPLTHRPSLTLKNFPVSKFPPVVPSPDLSSATTSPVHFPTSPSPSLLSGSSITFSPSPISFPTGNTSAFRSPLNFPTDIDTRAHGIRLSVDTPDVQQPVTPVAFDRASPATFSPTSPPPTFPPTPPPAQIIFPLVTPPPPSATSPTSPSLTPTVTLAIPTAVSAISSPTPTAFPSDDDGLIGVRVSITAPNRPCAEPCMFRAAKNVCKPDFECMKRSVELRTRNRTRTDKN
ncbi:leucine-rich repeat extensin-like protein 5 [Penaeus monodon]|uniref:leucine-rich repeat extensin-like protein 5 n=1 Tax=Penaeus monodon TaxID=6687 RepID=UPI0018A71B24|nr:leucine-rich repeat extensin-like protein 5 [Penaeus monodon]